MNKTGPIGIFDSGVGGTSIFKEVHQLLPLEHIIYLADSKNAPYGQRSAAEIIELSHKNTAHLVKQGCKLIIVACNTATTNAITYLRKTFDVPVIGIEPAIKPAALNSKNKVIGILATKSTLSSKLFTKTADLFTRHIEVIEVVGSGLVEAIEAGKENDSSTTKLLKTLLQPMLEKQIDYLVLGCSHYPYLIPQLEKLLPEKVNIIDSGQAVARQTKIVLKSLDLLNDAPSFKKPEFFSNKDTQLLQKLVQAEQNNFKVSYLDF